MSKIVSFISSRSFPDVGICDFEQDNTQKLSTNIDDFLDE